MVRHIHIVLDDDLYNKLKDSKDKLGLDWRQALIKGLECLERDMR